MLKQAVLLACIMLTISANPIQQHKRLVNHVGQHIQHNTHQQRGLLNATPLSEEEKEYLPPVPKSPEEAPTDDKEYLPPSQEVKACSISEVEVDGHVMVVKTGDCEDIEQDVEAGDAVVEEKVVEGDGYNYPKPSIRLDLPKTTIDNEETLQRAEEDYSKDNSKQEEEDQQLAEEERQQDEEEVKDEARNRRYADGKKYRLLQTEPNNEKVKISVSKFQTTKSDSKKRSV